MNNFIYSKDIIKTIKLDQKRLLIILDRLAKEDKYGKAECARNIFLIDSHEKILWQIRSDFDQTGGPFTNILITAQGDLKAYRWDGCLYNIELETGKAIPESLWR